MGHRPDGQHLANLGIPAPRSGVWWRDTISKILRNPAYTGVAYVHRYNSAMAYAEQDENEWIPIEVPAIIDRDKWLRSAGCGLQLPQSGRVGRSSRCYYAGSPTAGRAVR